MLRLVTLRCQLMVLLVLLLPVKFRAENIVAELRRL
jgi:hypothetical protein